MAKRDEKPDEFCDDGTTRKLNKSKPHGIVYSAMLDEWKGKPMPVEEAAFVQNGISYRGDGIPVGYKPAAERGLEPVTPPVEEVLAENEQLKRQIAALMKRVDALETAKPATPVTGLPPPPKEPQHAGGSKRV